MGDLKLFRIKDEVRELAGTSVAIEKSIQTLIEKNMETFFALLSWFQNIRQARIMVGELIL